MDAGAASPSSPPKAMPADQEAVGGMVTALSALMADRVVDEKPADLNASFGLTYPKEQVHHHKERWQDADAG